MYLDGQGEVRKMKAREKISRKFATTFVDGYDHPKFKAAARKIDVPTRLDSLSKKEFFFRDEALLFWRVIRAAIEEDTLLLFSSRGRLKPELLAMAFMGLWPQRLRPTIAMYGEMFEPNFGLRHWVERFIMMLVDRAVHRYIVFSRDEIKVFSHTWGVREDKIRVCHQFYAPPETSMETSSGKHIFGGGQLISELRAFDPSGSKNTRAGIYHLHEKIVH